MMTTRPTGSTRRHFLQIAVCGLLGFSICRPLAAQSREIPAVVSPDWLSKNLADPHLIILDIRTAEQYRKSHIPGSVLSPMSLWAIPANGLSLELPAEDALRNLIGGSGIDSSSHVVVVNRTDTDFSRADATRVAWTCIAAGIPNASVLDGGFNRWVREIKTVTSEDFHPAPRNFTGAINRQMLASKAEVLSKIGKATLLDTRVPEDYFGISSKPGHIKGAVNLPTPWAFSDNGTFRGEPELREMASGVIGPNKSKEVITYCGVGGFAAAWWFVLTQILGYRNVKVYDGSMEEWLKDPASPSSSYIWR